MGVHIIVSPEIEKKFREVVLEVVPNETIDRLGKLIQKVYADKG